MRDQSKKHRRLKEKSPGIAGASTYDLGEISVITLLLNIYTKGQLNAARIPEITRLAELLIVNLRLNVVPRLTIEQVEYISTELEVIVVEHLEVLRIAQVHLPVAITTATTCRLSIAHGIG